MAHWAKVDNSSLVLTVTVGSNDDPDEGYNWLRQHLGGTWIKTSYNTHGGVHHDPETGEPSADQSKALRYNYAGIGYTYDEERDAFIPPKPFESWVLDEATCLWNAPVPYPEDGQDYIWDETAGGWVVSE